MIIFGGQGEHGCLNDMHSFDTKKFEWVKLGEKQQDSEDEDAEPVYFPPARRGHTLTHMKGKLYLFGGEDENKVYNDLWCFDLKQEKWTLILDAEKEQLIKQRLREKEQREKEAKADPVQPAHEMGAEGGEHGEGAMEAKETVPGSESPVSEDQDDTLPHPLCHAQPHHLPLPRAFHTAALLGTSIVIFGGRDKHTCFNDTWDFNTENNAFNLLEIDPFAAKADLMKVSPKVAVTKREKEREKERELERERQRKREEIQRRKEERAARSSLLSSGSGTQQPHPHPPHMRHSSPAAPSPAHPPRDPLAAARTSLASTRSPSTSSAAPSPSSSVSASSVFLPQARFGHFAIFMVDECKMILWGGAPQQLMSFSQKLMAAEAPEGEQTAHDERAEKGDATSRQPVVYEAAVPRPAGDEQQTEATQADTPADEGKKEGEGEGEQTEPAPSPLPAEHSENTEGRAVEEEKPELLEKDQEEEKRQKSEEQHTSAVSIPPLDLSRSCASSSSSLDSPKRTTTMQSSVDTPMQHPSSSSSSSAASASTTTPSTASSVLRTPTSTRRGPLSTRGTPKTAASARGSSSSASATTRRGGMGSTTRFGFSTTRRVRQDGPAGADDEEKKAAVQKKRLLDSFVSASILFNDLWLLSTGFAKVLGVAPRPVFDQRQKTEEELAQEKAQAEKEERERKRKLRMEQRAEARDSEHPQYSHISATAAAKAEEDGEKEGDAREEGGEPARPASRASRLSHIARVGQYGYAKDKGRKTKPSTADGYGTSIPPRLLDQFEEEENDLRKYEAAQMSKAMARRHQKQQSKLSSLQTPKTSASAKTASGASAPRDPEKSVEEEEFEEEERRMLELASVVDSEIGKVTFEIRRLTSITDRAKASYDHLDDDERELQMQSDGNAKKKGEIEEETKQFASYMRQKLTDESEYLNRRWEIQSGADKQRIQQLKDLQAKVDTAIVQREQADFQLNKRLAEFMAPQHKAVDDAVAAEKARTDQESVALDAQVEEEREGFEKQREERKQQEAEKKKQKEEEMAKLKGGVDNLEQLFTAMTQEADQTSKEYIDTDIKQSKEIADQFKTETQQRAQMFAVVEAPKQDDENGETQQGQQPTLIGDSVVARLKEVEKAHEDYLSSLQQTLETNDSKLEDTEQRAKVLVETVENSIARKLALEKQKKQCLEGVKALEALVEEVEDENSREADETTSVLNEAGQVCDASAASTRKLREEQLEELIRTQMAQVSAESELFSGFEEGFVHWMKEGKSKSEDSKIQMSARASTLAANCGRRFQGMEDTVKKTVDDIAEATITDMTTHTVSDTSLRVDALHMKAMDVDARVQQLKEEEDQYGERCRVLLQKQEESTRLLEDQQRLTAERNQELEERKKDFDMMASFASKFQPLINDWKKEKQMHVAEVTEAIYNDHLKKPEDVVDAIEAKLKDILEGQKTRLNAAEEASKRQMDEIMKGLIDEMTKVDEAMTVARENLVSRAAELARRHEEVEETLNSRLAYIEEEWKTLVKKVLAVEEEGERAKRQKAGLLREFAADEVKRTRARLDSSYEQMIQA